MQCSPTTRSSGPQSTSFSPVFTLCSGPLRPKSIEAKRAVLIRIAASPNSARAAGSVSPMVPMGGVNGLGMTVGGSVEYQGNTDPHFHGNVTLSPVYQHKTLKEIRDKIETGLLSVDAITLPARLLFARRA